MLLETGTRTSSLQFLDAFFITLPTVDDGFLLHFRHLDPPMRNS